MTFYTYMMRNHLNEDSPAGDLAGDMRFDKDHFPRNRPGKYDGWHDVFRGYLDNKLACEECMDTFEECWKQYVKYEKGRKMQDGKKV